MKVKVKICGIKRKEDIFILNRHQPDYAGFIFAQSPRMITISDAEKFTRELDKNICKAGVFVNEKPEKIVLTAKKCTLDIIQLHGDEPQNYIDTLKELFSGYSIQIWKVIRIKNYDSLILMNNYKVDAFVLDTYVKGNRGGTGKKFNWDIARKAAFSHRIVLAGGLDSCNVTDAVKTVSPYAVDVSSGVEINGVKDEDEIAEFIRMADSGLK